MEPYSGDGALLYAACGPTVKGVARVLCPDFVTSSAISDVPLVRGGMVLHPRTEAACPLDWRLRQRLALCQGHCYPRSAWRFASLDSPAALSVGHSGATVNHGGHRTGPREITIRHPSPSRARPSAATRGPPES